MHAKNHWVTITNCNPDYEFARPDGLGIWFLFESMNDASYAQEIKPALKRLNSESSIFLLNTCVVPKQQGVIDCGIFALAYAIAICEGVDPSKLFFHQNLMRFHFNEIINTGVVTQFPHSQLNTTTSYKDNLIDISNINLKYF